MSLTFLWQSIFPKQLYSKILRYVAKLQVPILSKLLIILFIKVFKINLNEAIKASPHQYATLEELFTRKLKPSSRLIDNKAIIISPCDGRITQIGPIQQHSIIQAKGVEYLVHQLLGKEKQPNIYQSAVTIYLAPKHYHRVHAPAEATLKKIFHIPGTLYSVNQKSVAQIPNLFCRNERVVFEFESPIGRIAVIMIAAMGVSQIQSERFGILNQKSCPKITANLDASPIFFKKGEEVAYFNLGSTVVLLLEKELTAKANDSAEIQIGMPLFN